MNDEIHDLLEAYFSNEMTNEQKVNFENRLGNEAELKKSFDQYKQVTGILEADVESGLRERFREMDQEETSQGSSFNKYWIIATIVLGVVIASFAFLKQLMDVNPVQIAAQYGVEQKIDKARTILPNETADEAELEYFSKMEAAGKLIENKKYGEARKVYESLDTNYSIIKDNQEWSIALSYYLEEGRSSEKFQKTLQSILKNLDHNCYPLAVKVDEEVNSFWGRFK